MGSVNIKTKGVRGGEFSKIKDLGQTVVFMDNNFRDCISFDAFEGCGSTYKRRNNAQITIRCGSQLWSGDIDSLHNILFDKDSWNETHFEITKVICKETEGECHIKKLIDIENEGIGGLYDFAKRLTDKFERDYKDVIWDGNYFDTLGNFLADNLYN